MEEKSNKLKSPLYSSGTPEMGTSNIVGKVDGPKGGKQVPDPLGYAPGGSSKK